MVVSAAFRPAIAAAACRIAASNKNLNLNKHLIRTPAAWQDVMLDARSMEMPQNDAKHTGTRASNGTDTTRTPTDTRASTTPKPPTTSRNNLQEQPPGTTSRSNLQAGPQWSHLRYNVQPPRQHSCAPPGRAFWSLPGEHLSAHFTKVSPMCLRVRPRCISGVSLVCLRGVSEVSPVCF